MMGRLAQRSRISIRRKPRGPLAEMSAPGAKRTWSRSDGSGAFLRLCDDPKAALAALQMANLEVPAHAGKPPRAGLLNDVRIASIRQRLPGRSGVDGEKPDVLGDLFQIE